MLSRVARLQRICWVCRLCIPRQAAAVPIRCPPSPTNGRQVRCVSDFSPQSKERIEALISGALDDFESKPSGSRAGKRRPGRRKKSQKRGDVHDKSTPWALEPEKDCRLSENCDVNATEGASTTPGDASTSDGPPTAPLPKSTCKGQPCPGTEEFSDEFLYRKSLGVDALGKPADAIIIKNPNKIRDPKKVTSEAVKEAQHVNVTGASFTWRDVISQKQDEVDESGFSKEIWENIEEMRPKDRTIITRKDFDNLVEYLVDGFTAGQLMTYLSRASSYKTLRSTNEPPYPWLTQQSAWAATEPLDRRSYKPKERQAVAILTAVWKLEIQEHIEGFGRTVVWLRPDIFSLVASPQSGIIGRLSADFLDESNKEIITSSLEDYRLSIYTRKPTVATILARLDEIVRTIKSQTISVDQVKQDNLETSVLVELEKITKTALKYNAASSTLLVSWLPETDVSNGKTESPADIVSRLLIGRETSPQHADARVLPRVKSKKSVFLTHQRDKRSMAWRDRLRHWYRFVSHIGKPTEAATEGLGFRTKIELKQPNAQSAQESNEVTAVFGHILHTEQHISQLKLAKSRRVLSPVIPHPAALTLVTADTPSPSTRKTAIVLNFAPESPPKTSLPGSTPLIRLRIPITPFTDLSNFSFPDASVLEAVMPWQESDVMLPDSSVDVRLTQKRLIPLDAKQLSLQAFLQDSDFNLLQGRLRTPSRISFAMPSFISTNQDTSSTDFVATPHIFMGLEIHQTIEVEWKSHTLRYSSIEAGQHGGQQQILSLVAGPLSNQGRTTTEEQLCSFLTLVEETARGAHFSWDEGYKLMSQRAAEQFSWDMMDTDYAQQDSTIAEETDQQPGLEHGRDGQEARLHD
ncbi:uncharacterized protein MAM_03187 [Metarhizium album ARSEF 1941]|uniref:Uncharacterized protein n=1 Tax=Metarhizium album (strain ARSEF 1941) TaxID=1081103 RepID=A0A0B2X0X2_METAS|nr:uncharacterized protein MAM_03187 [Metarhizium album ARSEF 1941]KHN98725.1 hypothetical protein MAM_03187 [Metarhizium album ARSEF 1941]